MEIEKIETNIRDSKSLIDSLLSIDNIDFIEDDSQCKICFQKKDEQLELKCGHSFCYDCLVESFKGNKCNYCKKSDYRICPYCRTPCTFLPLKEGIIPIKGVHREYGKKKKLIVSTCKGIIKSGPNKGKICGCSVKTGEYCGRHKKKNIDIL